MNLECVFYLLDNDDVGDVDDVDDITIYLKRTPFLSRIVR